MQVGDVDLSDPDAFAGGFPHEYFGFLRRECPVAWHSEKNGPGFWVAGERGVGFARLTGSPARPLREGDLPGPANDLAVDREHLWVGTEDGLVRFRLDAIRP